MKKSIDALLQTFIPISAEDQHQITGGTGTRPLTEEELHKIFNYDSLDQNTIQKFNVVVQDLTSSGLGLDLLLSLQTNNDADRIKLSTTDTVTQNAVAEYLNHSGTHELKMGNLAEYDDKFDQAMNAGTLAHELYHAYKDRTGDSDYGKVVSELDSDIFSALVTRQIDTARGNDDLYYHGSLVNSAVQRSPEAFQNEWNSMLNGNLSQENYNNLIDNFNSSGFTEGQSNPDRLTKEHDPIANQDIRGKHLSYFGSTGSGGGGGGSGDGGGGSGGSGGIGGWPYFPSYGYEDPDPSYEDPDPSHEDPDDPSYDPSIIA
jgi:uncharacterized membrane protein YgcG